jgi:hypothetical protein
MINPFIDATKYAERKRAHIQTSIVDPRSLCRTYDQLVRLIEEAYIAGYRAHIQDILRGRDERYERVDL